MSPNLVPDTTNPSRTSSCAIDERYCGLLTTGKWITIARQKSRIATAIGRLANLGQVPPCLRDCLEIARGYVGYGKVC